MPKVTVIIPIYGVEKYIEHCARSLFEQTLYDIEYLFINDCTKDRSLDILKSVLKEYPQRSHQTKIITMSANSGQAAVRRHGIQLATGEYIIHCDSDDWVDVNMYKCMYDNAVQTNSDIVICDFYQAIDANYKYTKACYGIEQDDIIFNTFNGKGYWTVCNKLVKKTLYSSIENYPKYNTGEDMVLSIQLMFASKKISYVSQPLYYYRLNNESIIRNQSNESIIKRFNQAVENTKVVQQFLKKRNYNIKYRFALDQIKFKQKNFITPLISNSKYYKLWMATFPDLLFKIWINPYIDIKKKCKFYLAALRLYKKAI